MIGHTALWSKVSLFLSITVVITACDFNDNKLPFCNFQQDSEDESEWIRHKGPTPTPGTGPSGDYPDGSKSIIFRYKYLYQDIYKLNLKIIICGCVCTVSTLQCHLFKR